MKTKKFIGLFSLSIISAALLGVLVVIFMSFNSILIKDMDTPLYNGEANLTQLNKETLKYKFINKISKPAITNGKENHILPSITIAQAILESNFGDSKLSSEYNNYFGIKSDVKGKYVTMDTQEYENGVAKTVKANFETFNTIEESLDRHSQLFIECTTDNPDRYKNILNNYNYKDVASLLVKDGYATDPSYATKIISIIEKYNLDSYDKYFWYLLRKLFTFIIFVL